MAVLHIEPQKTRSNVNCSGDAAPEAFMRAPPRAGGGIPVRKGGETAGKDRRKSALVQTCIRCQGEGRKLCAGERAEPTQQQKKGADPARNALRCLHTWGWQKKADLSQDPGAEDIQKGFRHK